MARIADPTSKRQRAFSLIEKQPNIKRAPMLDIIMAELGVSKGYANTLFESHRTEQKMHGLVTEIFFIRDVRDGYIVEPFISRKFIPNQNVTRTSPNTIAKAVAIYEKEVRKRISIAKKLKK